MVEMAWPTGMSMRDCLEGLNGYQKTQAEGERHHSLVGNPGSVTVEKVS